MNVEEISNLAKAVNRWLSYQLLCGRDALLSEAYLGQPMAEFFLHRHSGQFHAEMDHPILQSPGPGRPKQIDYALTSRNSHDMVVALECKWISSGNYDKQRLLNDLLRLECIRVPNRHVKRFFLVAGLAEDFKKNFQLLKSNTGGGPRASFTTSLLSFSSNAAKREKSISARECPKWMQAYYSTFAKDFKTNVPKTFKTTLLERRSADDIAVAIWQISSAHNRTEFNPSEHWSKKR